MDGAIIGRDDLLYALSKEAGMPEPEAQGQNKSFIVSPNAKEGALLGKYMFHAAGPTLTAAMKKAGVHFIMPQSAAKQIGNRKVGDYSVTPTGRLSFSKGTQIYGIKPEEIHTVYSELQDMHMIRPQRAYKQMFTNLTAALADKDIDVETIKDMTNQLVEESYQSTPYGVDILTRYNRMMDTKKVIDAELQKEFLDNIDEIAVPDIITILQKKGHENFADRIYEQIIGINNRILAEAVAEGELDEASFEDFLGESREFRSGTERALGIGEEINKKTGEPVLSVALHKFNRPFVQQVVKNYIVHRATRPLVLNSVSARMRPYDKRLEHKFKDMADDVFYLDDNYRNTRIYSEEVGENTDKSGRKWIRLEDLWNQRKRWEGTDIGKHVDQIFRGLAARVPIDSLSGVRKLNFGGFTERKGYGVLLHPRVMRALGGADLDGDKATIYFGGRKENGTGYGFKESWMDMYDAQRKEFTRYKDRTGKVYTEDMLTQSDISSGRYEPYTTDNKREPFMHGDLKGTGTTPRDLMTTDVSKLPAPYNNPKFAEGLVPKGYWLDKAKGIKNPELGMYYYLPIAREWMAEAASRGRQLLGSAASLKNNIQAAHSTLSSMPDQTHEDRAVIPVYWKRPTAGKKSKAQKVNIGIHFSETAKTDKENAALYRDLSRTSIDLPSEPIDEI